MTVAPALTGIVGELRLVSGMRGRSVLFKLDGKSDAIQAVASEELLQANRDVLKDDEFVIVQGKVQPDRFAGGLCLMVQQVWGLAGARCRFGKYLEVEANGSVPLVSEVLREFPSRRIATEHGDLAQGLTVRVRVKRARQRRARPRRGGELLPQRRRARALARGGERGGGEGGLRAGCWGSNAAGAAGHSTGRSPAWYHV